MGKFNKSGKKGMPELNTSSLPDLIFTMLFFFIISDGYLSVNGCARKEHRCARKEHLQSWTDGRVQRRYSPPKKEKSKKRLTKGWNGCKIHPVPCGNGGIGRRAWFRFMCSYELAGSSPVSRTEEPDAKASGFLLHQKSLQKFLRTLFPVQSSRGPAGRETP